MDSSKHESSSYENDKKEKINFENSEAPRSYDCAFCKRGFTNAQALGGHMNIHRKEKAKAKKLSESTVNAHKSCEYFTPISDEQAQYYGSLRENKSYQMFSSPPNPSLPHAYPQMVSHPELFTPYGEIMGSNLNLRIGLPLREEEKEEIKRKEGERNRLVNEVDLELRLGQNP